MKRNWEYKKLGDVCTVVGGSTPKTNIPEYWGGGNYWVTPAELTGDKYIESTERTITDEAVAKTNLTLLPVGTVLLSSRAPIGKVCITRSPMYCNQGFKNIVCSKCLYNEYVYWWLKGKTDYLNSLGVGATFKEISKRAVEQIVIPVPPLSEQSRIVAELDLLTGIIDKQNAQLKELDNLAQAIFYDMFGDPIENPKRWKVKNIGDIADVKIGPFGSLLHASDYVNGGHPVINPVHLKAGKIVAEDDFTVNDDMYAQMMSYVLHKNDIVFGRRGDIGRCALVTQEQDGYLCGTGSLFVRFNIQVQPLFSVATLMHKSITDFLLKKAKGATMLNINCGIVEDIPFILPPLALQQSFAEKIQSIEKQKETIRASIADTQKLLDYTMDKYFG